MDPTDLHVPALSRACQSVGAEKTALVFSLETERADADVHVRFFAPTYGIPEDPATGRANGALGAYLVEHGALAAVESTTHIISEQGAEMGRPSTLYIEVDTIGDEPVTVRVGGTVAPIIEGKARF